MQVIRKRRALPGPPSYPLICIYGIRKAGKSGTDENIQEYYYVEMDYLTMDLWASQDLENAYWCIPDLYFISLDHVPGYHEFRLAKFCRQKYGLEWFKLVRDKKKKKLFVRNYRIAKSEDGKTITVTSLKGEQSVQLVIAQDGKSVTVTIPGVELAENMRTFEIEQDIYGHPRVKFPNPDRKDNKNWRTVGYPVLIILPDTTSIEQHNPLCVCGRPLKDHKEREEDPNYPCFKREPLIKTVLDTTPLAEIVAIAMKEKRVVVFNRGFYDIEEQTRAYRVIYTYILQIPQLVNRKIIPPKKSIILSFRELGSLVPKKMKTIPGTGVTDVKRVMIYFLNEARHFRTTIVTDFQAGDEILGEVVSKKDLGIMKKSTKDIIPQNLQWFYDLITKLNKEGDDELDEIRRYPLIEDLKPNECYMIYPDGYPRFEFRSTRLPQFKHKESMDDWEYLANCKIHFDFESIGRRKKGGKAKPMSEEDKMRDRAYQVIHELKNKNPDWDWEKLAKEAGLVNSRTGKIMDADGARMGYGRWKKKKSDEAVGGGDDDADGQDGNNNSGNGVNDGSGDEPQSNEDLR
jgi:hypothetical protein